jgi:hypothetical protein
MSRYGLLVLGVLLLAALLPADALLAVQPAAPGPTAAEERAATFAWFGKLGYPDVQGCKLVLVATGRSYQHGNDPPRNSYLLGFVLEEKGRSFTVLSLDLETHSFQGKPEVLDHTHVGYEKLPLQKTVVDYLTALQHGEPGKQGLWKLFSPNLSSRGEAFVLAWACWRHGLDREAAALYKQAAAMPDRGGGEGAPPPLRQALARDLAYMEMWRSVLAFGEPKVSRAQLLQRFRRFLRNYPDSEYAPRAREMSALLAQMVQEDAEHARATARKLFAARSKDERIADLIFRLRDQNGYQFSQPGACDVFWTRKDSPAHQLLRHGYDAVPRLIEALEDRRFTRSVGFHRAFYFSHHVLRVSDAAEQILTRIAGRSFYVPSHTNEATPGGGKAPTFKEQIRAWYAELRQKGEKRLLIEATEKADTNSPSQGRRLLEKYPNEALPALIAGAKAAKGDWLRSALVRLAGELKDESPVPFLQAELQDGPLLAERLAAAQALHRRGRPEAVAAMIAEWQGKPPASRDVDRGVGLDEVAQFLAGCGKVEAIDELARGLRRRPLDLRLAVVSAFAEEGITKVFAKGGGGKTQPEAGGDHPEKIRAAVERFLLAALDDTEKKTNYYMSWNGKSISDPRICDITGHVLHQLDPTRHPFDLGAPQAARDRSILALKIILRKARGLPPLP